MKRLFWRHGEPSARAKASAHPRGKKMDTSGCPSTLESSFYSKQSCFKSAFRAPFRLHSRSS